MYLADRAQGSSFRGSNNLFYLTIFAMAYNLSTQARLQAQKDICEELAKEGKVYIDVSLKALQAFQESLQGLDFYAAVSRPCWVRIGGHRRLTHY